MKNICNLLLIMAINHGFAQHTLSGSVVDDNAKTPIAFANIYLPQLEKGVPTDENGVFILNDLPSGNYNLLVSFIGYKSLSVKITLPQTERLELRLSPSAIEIEDVIISTPFHKLQSDNVMKVERQSIEDLKTNGAITLAEGITNIAGVESVTTGLGIGKPVIRGLSSNRVLVYTQGIRLENQQYGDEHGLGVNSAGMESIEVIKGPASLLYGSDALGGVLYLNPERFAEMNRSSGDVSINYFSNTSGYNTSLGYKASENNFKFLFRGSVTEHADYNTDAYRVTNSRFSEKDFKTGLGYQKSRFKTEFRYNMNQSKIGLPETIGEPSKNRTPLLPYQNITNHVFSSKSTLFFNNSSLDMNFGYIYNDRKEFEDHDHDDEDEHEEDETLEAALQMKLKTANYDIKYNLPVLGKFETIVGVQGMSQSNTNYGEEILIPNASTNDIGVFATSHIHFENIDIQLGTRFDNRNIEVINHVNRTFNSFNGAIGFKTDLLKNVTTRVNLASGFRAPNLSELYSDGTHEGTNRYEIGNANLSNEQNIQADVSIELKNEHVEFFANGFYNTINDYIYLSPNGNIIDNDPVFIYLQKDARLYGGEFGFHLHPHPLDWLHLESSFETVTGKLENDGFLPLIPANNLNNTIRVEFEKSWLKQGYAFIKLQSTFSQNNAGDFETTTDGFNLLSAGFGGALQVFNKDLLINISGTNLTNATYINHLSRLKADGVFNIGRNINLGLTYKL